MAAPPRTPPPAEVDWSALSPRALEVVVLVTMRLAAGLSYDEIGSVLAADPPELRHLEPPARGYTKTWVSARHRELKREIEATLDG